MIIFKILDNGIIIQLFQTVQLVSRSHYFHAERNSINQSFNNDLVIIS